MLLDTHALMWWDSNKSMLSATALTALGDPANRAWLSVVSVWEMVIKLQVGKLTLRAPLSQIVADQQANGVQVLAVNLSHALAVESLPPAHRDPFDRLLAAQCIAEDMDLVTADPIFAQYPVRVLW